MKELANGDIILLKISVVSCMLVKSVICIKKKNQWKLLYKCQIEIMWELKLVFVEYVWFVDLLQLFFGGWNWIQEICLLSTSWEKEFSFIQPHAFQVPLNNA